MSVREELKVKQSSEDGDDRTTMVPPEVILHQSEFFDKVKEFLLSQQESLRQNLEIVKEKTGKSTLTRTQLTRERSKEHGTSIAPAPTSGTGSPVAQQNEEIQIQVCPICGMEFEDKSGNALENHVAEHWCSSSEFRGLSN